MASAVTAIAIACYLISLYLRGAAAGQYKGSVQVISRFSIWVGKIFALCFWIIISDNSGPAAIALLPLLVWLLGPKIVLNRVVIPLGSLRFTYSMARFSGLVELLTDSGVAALYSAIYLVRKSPSPQDIDWLTQKLKHVRSPRGAGVVAAALLALLRGDRHRARCLFVVADSLDWRLVPATPRVIARNWLVADAVERGNWRDVIRLGRRGRYSLRWSYAVARMGERLIGDPQGCGDGLLVMCWMIAPRRRAMLPMLRTALRAPRARKHPAIEPLQTAIEPPPGAADLPGALANLAHVLRDKYIHDGQSFAKAVHDLDGQVACAKTRALVQQRLLALGARHDADTVLFALRQRLSAILSPILESAPHLVGENARGPILDQAIAQARGRLFGDIEAQCKDYDHKKSREITSEPIAAWEMWAVTRDCAERLIGVAPGAADALFQLMWVRANNFAVFQQNKGQRHILAHEIYSWLYRHSQGDPSASALLLGNARRSAA
jgi:hypothetical protein